MIYSVVGAFGRVLWVQGSGEMERGDVQLLECTARVGVSAAQPFSSGGTNTTPMRKSAVGPD